MAHRLRARRMIGRVRVLRMNLLASIDSMADSPELRPYLAGVGAMAALIAGAVVVFLSVATFVAFHGLPSGGSSAAAGAGYVGSPASGAPGAAGAALGAAHAAVARDPVPGSHGGGGGGSSAGGSGGSSDQLGGPSASPPAPTAAPPAPTPEPSASAGPVESAVTYVNQATGPLGVTAPTGPAGTLDDTARNTLNGAQPGLGDRVSRTGSRLIDGLPQP
jgi:hypothetical protein